MNVLYTIAYPELEDADRSFIEDLRAKHDPVLRALVLAHFTLVFACDLVPLGDYLAHVDSIARQTETIAFTLDRVEVKVNDGSGTAYVFLVPGRGRTEISRLHDALYSGVLEPYLDTAMPFMPHITVAALPRDGEAHALCAELDARGLGIHGMIRALTVGSQRRGRFVHHGHFALAKETT